MPNREPGWYWVRRKPSWDAEPRYFGGRYWAIDHEHGHLFEDNDLAVIYEQRIPEPEPLPGEFAGACLHLP